MKIKWDYEQVEWYAPSQTDSSHKEQQPKSHDNMQITCVCHDKTVTNKIKKMLHEPNNFNQVCKMLQRKFQMKIN